MSEGATIDVNGLAMYYEEHGSGKPLVLLHGGFGRADMWQPVLPFLTPNRRVIAPEQQGHGHTPDRDEPLTFARMADDTAALIRALDAGPADIFGYSDGGALALALTIRHPELVDRLATIGAVGGPIRETYEPETAEQLFAITPENFNPPELRAPYEAIAPEPTRWPVLVQKTIDLSRDFPGYTTAELATITVPALVMFSDGEGIRLEHAVELWRTLPDARIAVFPGADHFLLFNEPERVVSTLLRAWEE